MAKVAKPTLLLIDGHSLAFRAFYALPPEGFRIATGQYTNAVHGFLLMLLSLLDTEKPASLGVAFDLSRHSFRTEEYPEYKGTRGETPPEFLGQTESLQESLVAMNITTITRENYEADDILATLAREGAEQGYKVLVVSGDRDTIQLVNDDVTLLYPVKGVSSLVRYDPQTVFAKYAVQPQNYPDIAALVGETSDNLPGVPGVGPKTAAKWIAKYGDVYQILEHADDIPGKVGESLRDHTEDVLRNRKLNRLVTDVSLPVSPADLALTGVDPAQVDEVFGKLELRTVGARVRALGDGLQKVAGAPTSVPSSPGAAGGASSAATASGAAGALSLVVDRAAPEQRVLSIEDAAAWLTSADPVGVSFEFAGPDLIEVGVSTDSESIAFAWTEDSPATAVVIGWLESAAPKVFHDAKPALKRLDALGIHLAGIVGDSMLAWYILDPTKPTYDLKHAATAFFTAPLPEPPADQLAIDEQDAPAGTYAWFALSLYTLLAATLPEKSFSVILQSIEMPLLPVLAKMEETGVAIDVDLIEQYSDTLADRAQSIASEAFKVIGHEMNLGSPKQLQEVLFQELGMPKTRQVKTGYTTDAEALTTLFEKTEHPFLELLLRHRDATKLRQMLETLRKSVADDGRIHTTYSQAGTATGRLSSVDPNLQNIPVKTEDGRHIRAGFIAGPGFENLLSADYSQIEMRIMAHLSRDDALIEAFQSGEDLHRYVGSKVFQVTPAEVTPAMRSKVKAMSYGLVYGLSAFGLARQLRITQAEAKDLMNGYFERFGGVRDYLRNVVEQAKVDGYTETAFGRRRPFPDFKSHNRVLRDNAARAALNAPIQGSAADIMKLAMLRVDDDLREAGLRSRMLLQVHDELIFEVAPGEQDSLTEVVLDGMGKAADIDVPLDVHIGIGANWNAAAH